MGDGIVLMGLAQCGICSFETARKAVHMTAAPIFMWSWWLYPDASTTSILLAACPALFQIIALMALLLLSHTSPHYVPKCILRIGSRSGKPVELLLGPGMYYCIVVWCTITGFRSYAAVLTLSILAGGDGCASVAGRKWGKTNPLPWNTSKSWLGMGAFVVGSMTWSLPLLTVAAQWGWVTLSLSQVLCALLLCCLGAVIESVDSRGLDNMMVGMLVYLLALLPQ